jgi:predicted secreted protein
MTLVQHQLKGEPVDVSFVDIVDKDSFEGDKGATGSVEVASTGMRIWGKALITAISLSAPTEGESTFQVSLQGTGAWSVDKIGEESASA